MENRKEAIVVQTEDDLAVSEKEKDEAEMDLVELMSLKET